MEENGDQREQKQINQGKVCALIKLGDVTLTLCILFLFFLPNICDVTVVKICALHKKQDGEKHGIPEATGRTDCCGNINQNF